MAALDRELTRGERFVARAEDLGRLASPLLTLTRSLFERRRRSRDVDEGEAEAERRRDLI